MNVKSLPKPLISSDRNSSYRPLRAGRLVARAVISIAASTILLGVIAGSLALHKMPAPPVQIDTAATVRLLSDVRRVQSSKVNGASRVLRIDETELNSYIHAQLDRHRSKTNPEGTLDDLRIALRGDLMHVFVAYQLHGKDMTLDVEGRLNTTGGYVGFELLNARVGALLIPRATFQSALQRMMQYPATREAMRLPPDVGDVVVEGDRIVLTYK
jgi:hypothetical protein